MLSGIYRHKAVLHISQYLKDDMPHTHSNEADAERHYRASSRVGDTIALETDHLASQSKTIGYYLYLNIVGTIAHSIASSGPPTGLSEEEELQLLSPTSVFALLTLLQEMEGSPSLATPCHLTPRSNPTHTAHISPSSFCPRGSASPPRRIC